MNVLDSSGQVDSAAADRRPLSIEDQSDKKLDEIAPEPNKDVEHGCTIEETGFRRIVRNFTPSWFIITMSTGITSILLHQLPYNGLWLRIIADIFFVLNIALFVLFSLISATRYTLYPHMWSLVVRHPHQSLFLATFPVGLGTIINMVVLVCVPAWGQNWALFAWALFAWALWWLDSLMALGTCFHLTYIIMSHRRSELHEMTALYLIPIVAVVIAASSGSLLVSVLHREVYRLWTLIISYIFWGIGTPLSWIILTLYFLRMGTERPLKREVIVSLLLPIGPLGLSGFSIVSLGKQAKVLFALTHSLPHVQTHPGDVFYIVGVLVGLILWGSAIVWFVVAVMMLAVSGGFPFNMGWWDFIFPVGVFTLQTITLGEGLASHFLEILSCVLTGTCIVMWLVVAAGTVRRSITGEMFLAPCLGTDLYKKKFKKDPEVEERRPEKNAA